MGRLTLASRGTVVATLLLLAVFASNSTTIVADDRDPRGETQPPDGATERLSVTIPIDAYDLVSTEHGTEVLAAIPEVRQIGTADRKAGVLSFLVEGVHTHDVGTILDMEGIAVRTGQHCAQPVMDHFGIPATTRASLAFYNTKEELDRLGAGLRKVVEMFA